MANDINRVILVGRLTRDPELKSTNSGSYLCRFTLASNRTIFQKDGENKEEVGFFDCVAWGKLAEIISKYSQKGRRVGIDGSLRFSSWENTEGKRQSKVEVFVENFQFLDAKNANENPMPAVTQNMESSEKPESYAENFSEPFNDDIPF
ncbi:MAG: single-stranded DNA-binding protein [Spirochaetia bacterium]|nr:single-stranded DNA-binding protein [Spirochaetia bacterium]